MTAITRFPAGTRLCAVELDNIGRAAAGDGVVSGCTPSQRAAGVNMSVDVAAGTYWVGLSKLAFAGANLPLTAADGTNPRWDIVYLDASGLHKSDGTADPNPKAPDLPAASVLVALVDVQANVGSVDDTVIRNEVQLLPAGLVKRIGVDLSSSASKTIAVDFSLFNYIKIVAVADTGDVTVDGHTVASNGDNAPNLMEITGVRAGATAWQFVGPVYASSQVVSTIAGHAITLAGAANIVVTAGSGTNLLFEVSGA